VNVLFVCIGNQGRSQMAQGFLERHGGHEVHSAGSAAGAHLHPEVVEAMHELGIDLSDRRPRQLDPVADAAWADLVVTMGCGDVCRVLPGTSYIEWGIEDPFGEPLERVRGIRDEIAQRVEDLAAGLDPARTPSA